MVRVLGSLTLLSLLASPGLWSQPSLAQLADGEELVFYLEGREGLSSLTVSAVIGEAVQHGIRVYSEPSHTLLLFAVSEEFADSPRGKAALSAARSTEAHGIVTTAVPGGAPRVEVGARPEGDDRIAVWVIQEAAEILVADGKVGAGSFSFQTIATVSDGDVHNLIGQKIRHCCNGSCGNEQCKTCQGPYFTCCYCNNIGCGWYDCPSG